MALDATATDLNVLYQRARAGDDPAESQLFELLAVRFRLVAQHYLGKEQAADVAQDACMAVLQKYRTETMRVSFAAWCHGVLKMSIRSQYRKMGRLADQEAAIDFATNLAGPAASPGLATALRECLKGVLDASREYARALVLSYQGLGTTEICRRLGVTPSHYYVLLWRGRDRLKRCLDDKGFLHVS